MLGIRLQACTFTSISLLHRGTVVMTFLRLRRPFSVVSLANRRLPRESNA